jgi:hypothetical protein
LNLNLDRINLTIALSLSLYYFSFEKPTKRRKRGLLGSSLDSRDLQNPLPLVVFGLESRERGSPR